jgi:phenylalanine-4-hydroxylase
MVAQNYDSYSEKDHNTWSLLFKRQSNFILNEAAEEFKKGFKMLSISPDKVVNLEELNKKLSEISAWNVTGVSGLVPNNLFFSMLKNKKFPVTVTMRKPEELAFSELPDIFHDVYGHVAMLLNETFSKFMVEYSRIALKYIDDETTVSYFGRLYWFTLEMGLIKEGGHLKPYGGAILTSSGEIENINNPSIAKYPFDLEKVIHTEYDNLKVQKEYFFIESFEQLFSSLHDLDVLLARRKYDFEKIK